MPASRPKNLAKSLPRMLLSTTSPEQGVPLPAPVRGKPRLIESEADILAGIKALRRKCPIMRRVHDATGLPPLRRRAAGLEGLARIVVGQQVSVASAAAIWERTFMAVQPFDAPTLLAKTEPELRAAGLSGPKIRTLLAVGREIAEAGLDLGKLDHLADDEIHAALTRISGIGPWTADVYLMFCIGRADTFASGDLALQAAAQLAIGLEARPSADELRQIAERWRPWRGVAARLLWAYYRVLKDAKSGVPV